MSAGEEMWDAAMRAAKAIVDGERRDAEALTAANRAPIFAAERRSLDEALALRRVIFACERWGYGNVMQATSVAWRAKDPVGAFAVGVCFTMLEKRGCASSLELMDKYDALLEENAKLREELAVKGESR